MENYFIYIANILESFVYLVPQSSLICYWIYKSPIHPLQMSLCILHLVQHNEEFPVQARKSFPRIKLKLESVTTSRFLLLWFLDETDYASTHSKTPNAVNRIEL